MRKINYEDLEFIGPVYKDIAIRQLREPLLKAFDIYKINVFYGIEKETEEERKKILDWYQSLLDKEDFTLKEIPEKIKKYL